MTEAQLQDAILETAALLGWLCYHARPARTGAGWRTAAQGNGAAGFPDVVMARDGRLIFAELKSGRGKLSAAQEEWRVRLERVGSLNAGVWYVVWTPADWTAGVVEETLR